MENRPVKSGICPVKNVKSGMSPKQSVISLQLKIGNYFGQS